MSIKTDYLRYLNHFGKTSTVRDFASDRENSRLIALRHDVDHDLDIALEMSYHEHQQGFRSTYYLLDTAPYWSDPDLINKCLQMTDYGHEIGLHINVLAKWIKGDISDISTDLQSVTGMLRNAGVDIKTVSTHGDTLCYSQQFINYWCFRELKPDNPVGKESGLSAEGIPVQDPHFQIHYPPAHQLQREDGSTFQFWSVSMQELGLEHDAMHIPYDSYYSDSGGWWTRTPDPIEQDVSKGRIQVLMHPEYWRGPQKLYFFLSAPRSGSTWLANFIDKATPLTGKHEFSLNHRYQDKTLTPDKRTLDDLPSLLNDPVAAKELLLQARAWMEDNVQDYGEANVYLHHFMNAMNEVFPDATLVLLHRHPADVVRSLLNRDWYDTPEDERHPPVQVKNWNELNQFEKICCFTRRTNETLLPACQYRISFEMMTTDPEGFMSALEAMGIPVYPRMVASLFSEKLNASKRTDHPPYDQWNDKQKKTLTDICDGVCSEFGYALDGNVHLPAKGQPSGVIKIREREVKETCLLDIDLKEMGISVISGDLYGYLYQNILSRLPEPGIWKRLNPTQSVTILESTATGQPTRIWTKGCYIRKTDQGLSIRTIPGIHSNVLIGASSWNRISVNEGWSAQIGYWCRGSIKLTVPDNNTIMLLCLMYDKQGNLYDKRSLVRLHSANATRKFSFSTRVNTDRFSLALYRSLSDDEIEFLFEKISLEKISSAINQLN